MKQHRKLSFCVCCLVFSSIHQLADSFLCNNCCRRRTSFCMTMTTETEGNVHKTVCADTPALQYFMEKVIAMQEDNFESIRILPSHDESNEGSVLSDDCVLVNSLVFQVDDDTKDYLLVVIDCQHRVDVSALRKVLVDECRNIAAEDSEIALAPADSLQSICGFSQGTIPPIGFFKPPMVTIIDHCLQKYDYMEGGSGGLEGMTCRLKTQSLISQPNTFVAASSIHESAPRRRAVDPDDDQRHFDAFKPFFVASPPTIEQAEAIVAEKDDVHVEPQLIQTIGRISGIRRMARTLCFVDFAPVNGVHTSQDHPWRNPLHGQPMAVQLICGKTFCQRFENESDAVQDINELKVDRVIMIQGRTNEDNTDSMKHWIQKTSLDVVLFDWELVQLAGSRKVVPQPTRDRKAGVVDKVLSKHKAKGDKPSKFPFLTVEKAYPTAEVDKVTTLIDSLGDNLLEFDAAVSCIIEKASSPTIAGDAKQSTGSGVSLVGIDCEWRPSFYSETDSQPVMLLQVCLHDIEKVFIFDLKALFRPMLEDSQEMNDTEQRVAKSLGTLFSSPQLVKVGFQLGQDLKRLSASFPHVSQLHRIESVLEVSVLTKNVFQITGERNVRQATSSLRALTERLLSFSLDKKEQISDWASRPLTMSQLEYAALDAIVTPLITAKLMEMATITDFDGTRLGREIEDERAFPRMIYSWRFLFYNNEDKKLAVEKFHAKSIIRDEVVVGQQWVTGCQIPAEPKLPASLGGSYIDVSGKTRVPSYTVQLSADGIAASIGSMIGKRIGKSKDRCIHRLAIESSNLPTDSLLEYKARSGYIELENAVALFVNMPGTSSGGGRRSYPNEWSNEGQSLSWFIHNAEWADGTSRLASKMHGPDTGTVFLFVRIGRGPYICCGRCEVSPLYTSANNQRLTQLNLGLQDWAQLTTHSDFQRLVDPSRPAYIPTSSSESYPDSDGTS